MIRIEPRDGVYRITFPYNPAIVETVKKIPGRKWDKETKAWLVPQCLTTRSFIKHLLPGIIMPDVHPPRMVHDHEYQPPLKSYKHQEMITKTLMRAVQDGKSIALFAETGTGKTKAILDLITHFPQRRALVVCPRPLMGVWEYEASRWCCAKPTKVHGNKRVDPRYMSGDGMFALTSYGTFVNDIEKWRESRPYDIVVFDEAHLLKNKSSQRSKACRSFDAATKIPMTGTPYGNEYKDLWAIMDSADPAAFGPWGVFAGAYCVYGGWEDKEIIGYQNLDLMMNIVRHTSIVVRKDQCLDLPPKQYQTINVDMGDAQRKAYRRCEAGGVGDMPISSVLTMIGKLRQISSGFVYGEDGEVLEFWPSEKIQALSEMCWDTPTVIWHNFTEEGNMIASLMCDLGVTYTRAMGDGFAYQAARDFESGKIQVIIAQMQTLQYGVTMNRATRSIYFSGTFSSQDRAQSEDRNHRIGQSNSVLYIDFIASPIEQWIFEACSTKSDVREHILKKLSEMQNNA